MDTLDTYRHIIRETLTAYAHIPYAHGEIRNELVFDRETDRYVLMILGREQARRVHGCLVHIDIIDGKVWIQRDGTEQGMANVLVEAGIPKDHIVLGFHSPALRTHTEFAVV